MNTQALKQAGWALLSHIRGGDWSAFRVMQTKLGLKCLSLFLLPLGLLIVPILRLIRPWFLVRINILSSGRIGHFAANTELYVCEREAGINRPRKPHIDLWYHNWPVCNQQLAKMWGRVLHVGPGWLLAPVNRVNNVIPGGDQHRIGDNTQLDRDVHNLLDRFPPRLSFLPEEDREGQSMLRALGIPAGAPFVCLNVRDGGYLRKSMPWRSWSYQDYRDCNVQNYIQAALELANRGYFVVRMGAVVKEAMDVKHPQIIDYAANGARTDFMDIYLGAKCHFCISNSTGFDAVPFIFRRPIVYVDHVPLGIISTYSARFLATTKKHWLRDQGRCMTFREIFASGADHFYYSSKYDDLRVDLLESTPDEIAAVVLEMESRLSGTWQTTEEDEALQRRFWEIFPRSVASYNSRPMHGEIRSRIGADFLRRSKALLE